jgi:transposase-like protein
MRLLISRFLIDMVYRISLLVVNVMMYLTERRDNIDSHSVLEGTSGFHEYTIVLNNKANNVVVIEAEDVQNTDVLSIFKKKYDNRNKILYAGILSGEDTEDVTELLRRFVLYFDDDSEKGCVSHFISYLREKQASNLIQDCSCELQIHKNDDDLTECSYKLKDIGHIKFNQVI